MADEAGWLAFLTWLAKHISQGGEIEPLCSQFLARLLDAIPVDRASLSLMEEERLRTAAWHGLSSPFLQVEEEFFAAWALDPDHELSSGQEEWQRPEPLLIADIATTDRFNPLHEAALAEGIRSLNIFPLNYQRRLAGILALYNDTPHIMAEAERQLTTGAVDLLAVAIGQRQEQLGLGERVEKRLALLKQQIAQRKQAEASLKRESDFLRLLQEVAVAANEADTAEEIYQTTVDKICRFTGWPVGHVFTRTPEGTLVSSRIWSCSDWERFRQFITITEQTRFEPGLGWLGKILESGEPAWLANVGDEPAFVRNHRLVDLGIVAGFASPVLVGSEVVAILEFFSQEATEPDPDLLDVMAHIGIQLGRVVEREQSERRILREQTLLAQAEQLAKLGSWEWRIKENKVIWSEELYRIYGIEPEEFGASYESFLERAHPEEREYIDQLIEASIQNKSPFAFLHRIVLPDGTVRDLHAQGKPVLDESGELVRMVGTGQDVTEQRETETKLDHHSRQLVALNEMGRAVTATLDLPSIFNHVLEKLVPLLGADGIFILLLEGEYLDFAATSEPWKAALEGQRVLPATGVAGEVLRTTKAIGLYGKEAGQRVFTNIVAATGFRPGALLVAPVRLRGEWIGVMEAIHRAPDGLDEDDLQMLEAAAAWTAVAIGNARLFAKQQQARQTAETLRDANLMLTQSLELNTVLSTLLDYLAELIDYDGATVMFVTGNRLRVRAVQGEMQVLELYQVIDPADTSLLRDVLDSGTSQLIENVSDNPGWIADLGRPEQVSSWLGIPLLAGSRIIGIVTAIKAKPRTFTKRELLLAEAIAGHAAVAVQNAYLYAQVKASRERLRFLTREIVSAQEQERRRVSRELHDEAGQSLTALKIDLGLIQAGLPDFQKETKEQLSEAMSLTDETMERIRLLAHDLRPPVLDTFGLAPAIEGLCSELAKRADLTIDFQTNENLPPLPEAIVTSLYRFAQEALTNVIKHAEATKVELILDYQDEMITVSIRDNGRGFRFVDEVELAESNHGIGLDGMRERLDLLNGRLEITSKPGQGTLIRALVPYQDRQEEL
ncbi:MAG: GAF domain-containing protein [Candidatus Promineifilaceae bacterium]